MKKTYDTESAITKRSYFVNRSQAELLKSIAAAKGINKDQAADQAIKEWNDRNKVIFD